MPDEHDVLIGLVQQLQEQSNQLAAQMAEQVNLTLPLRDFGMINQLSRIEQRLTNILERLDALEARDTALNAQKDSRNA